MHTVTEIVDILDSALKSMISEVRIRDSDGAIVLYLPENKVAEKVSPGFTSIRQLKNVERKLSKKFSKEVVVVFTLSSDHLEIESAIFTILKTKYPDRVLSLLFSADSEKKFNAWIEFIEPSDDLKRELESYLQSVFETIELSLGDITWISFNSDSPTVPFLLRLLKTVQPVSAEMLFIKLHIEYPGITERWLRNKLDQMRKKKLLVREQAGTYVLTYDALSTVPAGANRSSSDLNRALDLGRRKW
ncbi:MAG: hypothetical protein Q7V56_05095 [Gammaproteobacteria bacterium]|nr:hypothetical protein [Gammaproteobacteria bacterium]